MTQEERNLLFKDLCTRLPYKVRCKIKYYRGNVATFGINTLTTSLEGEDTVIGIDYKNEIVYTDSVGSCDIASIKPYLRPMSSMTDEEASELAYIVYEIEDIISFETTDDYIDVDFSDEHGDTASVTIWYDELTIVSLEFLLENHFDFRNLIEKGLAIEVNENNNPYK